jgi:pyruvate kinase
LARIDFCGWRRVSPALIVPAMFRERQTKIVATVGPSCGSEETLAALVEAGADVFRFNFSHGTHEEHAARFAIVRSLEGRMGRPIGVFADLQGPKLRLGVFEEGEIYLKTGDRFRLDLGSAPGTVERAPLPHPEVFEVLKPGASLLLDDGRVRLKVVEGGQDWVDTTVAVGGRLSDRKGLNLPDVVLARSPITEKDEADLKFALDLGFPMIALSFVQRPDDIVDAAKRIDGRARVIAKLEKPSAIRHLNPIVGLSDAIMVARGDLGVELPPEDVPSLQKRIIRTCRNAGRPVIVATQMLESMMNVPTPTRAEASDVANAVYEGADAVMLSGETAAGNHPVEAVTIMDRILRRTERDEPFARMMDAGRSLPETTASDAISAAARSVAETIGATAIVTFTTTGSTTFRAARERPRMPILALTPDEAVAEVLTLSWGVRPITVPTLDDFEDVIETAKRIALAQELVGKGDRLVVTAGLPLAAPGNTNALHIVDIASD